MTPRDTLCIQFGTYLHANHRLRTSSDVSAHSFVQSRSNNAPVLIVVALVPIFRNPWHTELCLADVLVVDIFISAYHCECFIAVCHWPVCCCWLKQIDVVNLCTVFIRRIKLQNWTVRTAADWTVERYWTLNCYLQLSLNVSTYSCYVLN